jgi:hypothetical protein
VCVLVFTVCILFCMCMGVFVRCGCSCKVWMFLLGVDVFVMCVWCSNVCICI